MQLSVCTMASPSPPTVGGKVRVEDVPFIELTTPFSTYEAIKMILLLPLVPIRATLGVLAFCLMTLVNMVAAYGCANDQPLSPWRRQLVLWGKELLIGTIWSMGFRVRVNGRENIAKAEALGSVILFNHVAW